MEIARQATATERTADEAMSRYAGGDDEAFGQLYAAVTPNLTRLFHRVLRDRTRVPDLVQETFLRVHRARRAFQPGSPALPWIMTIARHLVVDAHRLAAREEGTDVDRLDRLSHRASVDGAPTGEQVLMAKEVAVRLGRAFDRLPEGQRTAFRLVKSEGLSVAQAAAALGTTGNSVRQRTHKAYRKLRTALAVSVCRGGNTMRRKETRRELPAQHERTC